MKNIYFFFIFLFLTGCSFNPISNVKTTPISCPSILFSSEHKIYIGSSVADISVDNIEYRSEVNNAVFSKKCELNDNIFSSELSILFIFKPLVKELDSVDIPFYLAILNENKEVKDLLYFSVVAKIKKDPEKNIAIETDIIKILNLEYESIKENSIIIIGHVLDEKRKEILN